MRKRGGQARRSTGEGGRESCAGASTGRERDRLVGRAARTKIVHVRDEGLRCSTGCMERSRLARQCPRRQGTAERHAENRGDAGKITALIRRVWFHEQAVQSSESDFPVNFNGVRITKHVHLLIPHPRPVVQACSGAGEWRAALSILDDMQAEGLRPAGGAYVAAMEACARGGMMDLALELLDTVLQEHLGDERVRSPHVHSFQANRRRKARA